APDRGESELEASVDKLFDEGGSGIQAEQGDPAGGRGGLAKTSKEKETVVAGAGEPSHPPKKLREDHGTLSGASIYSSHLSGANIVEAGVDSFVRPFVSVIIAATTVTSTVDPAIVIKEKIVKPSLFSANSTSAGGTDPAMGSFTDLYGSDFLVGGIHTVISLDTDLQKVMEHDQIFTEFNVGAARQMSLSVEVMMHAEDEEIENLKVHLLLKEVEAAEAIRLRAKASYFEVTEKSLQDELLMYLLPHDCRCMSYRLYTDFVEVNLHLEERFYPHLLTTIAGHGWLITHGMKLAIAKCLNSTKYHSALGTAVSKAIKKGMQDGLAARITHGREVRALTDVAAHNPSTKDASIEALMNIMRLEEHLAKRLGLNESQPHADQLMVPIHHSLDKIVVDASALSLALDVSDVPLTRMEGTSDVEFDTADITTALSVTLTSFDTVTPLSVDDYEVMGTDD
nr:hypothetical protein [Tanacetum cinerariifolium]